MGAVRSAKNQIMDLIAGEASGDFSCHVPANGVLMLPSIWRRALNRHSKDGTSSDAKHEYSYLAPTGIEHTPFSGAYRSSLRSGRLSEHRLHRGTRYVVKHFVGCSEHSVIGRFEEAVSTLKPQNLLPRSPLRLIQADG